MHSSALVCWSSDSNARRKLRHWRPKHVIDLILDGQCEIFSPDAGGIATIPQEREADLAEAAINDLFIPPALLQSSHWSSNTGRKTDCLQVRKSWKKSVLHQRKKRKIKEEKWKICHQETEVNMCINKWIILFAIL